jgi:hypothetical protein
MTLSVAARRRWSARVSRLKRLGAAIITQYEGALILSRIGRDVEPLRTAGNVMRQLVADAR